MQLNDVRKATLSNKKRTRVGRGPSSGLGKTSGRGREGATARSGWSMIKTYEGGQMPLFRRLPKRGFRNGKFKESFQVVNLGDLAGAKFAAGSEVGREQLVKAGLLKDRQVLPLKVLGEGELKVALTINAESFSKSALEKIQKAGGKANWLDGAPKKEAPDFASMERLKQRKAAAVASSGVKKEAPKEGAKDDAKGGAKEAPKDGAPKAAKDGGDKGEKAE